MPRHSKEAECGDKYGYQNRKQANKVARYMQRNGEYLKPYRCSWCGKWHVGHPPIGSAVRRMGREKNT